MNRRPIGNDSKRAVIPFGFFRTNGCAIKLYWKKSTLDIKTCHFMELPLKFRPVRLSKCRKAYLFIVCKYSTGEVGFKFQML